MLETTKIIAKAAFQILLGLLLFFYAVDGSKSDGTRIVAAIFLVAWSIERRLGGIEHLLRNQRAQ